MQASDSCLFILLGGVFGFPLSFVLGLFSAATPGAAAVLLGLPLAVGAVWWIYGWIVEGQWPRWAAPVGFVVLLVNLSAAGGIGMPGVAGTFWILLALGVPNQPAKAFRSGAGWAGLVAALGLAVACYATAYRPVLNCQAQMQMAIRDLSRAREHLQSAAEADPWSAEPWRRLAALEFDAWMQNPGKEGWRQFERANDELLRRSAGAASAWLASGNWHLQAFQKTRQKELVDRAVSDLLRAVRLYPNSALHRAQLAEALWAADRRAEFRVEAETALRLDAATPHRDRKLPDSRRASLLERLRVPNHAARPALDAPNKPTI